MATSSSYAVTTLGELMLRLSVPAGTRLEQAAHLDVHPGGAEANVAALLARLGWPTAWHGALPAGPLGRLAANALRAAGVALDGVTWAAEGRMGTYFVEFAGSPRPIQVIYDRANSCAARWQPHQVHWETLLDTRLLHLTGITPALSHSCRAIVVEAVARARAAGVPVSFDVNFRSRLWMPQEAAAVLQPLLDGVALLFCGHADAVLLFGCAKDAEQAVRELAQLTGARIVVMSVGEGGVMAWDGTTLHTAPAVAAQVIDRLGAGDALAAGVMHGWLQGDLAVGLRNGVLLAALALSQYGDMVVTDATEVAALLNAQHSTLLR